MTDGTPRDDRRLTFIMWLLAIMLPGGTAWATWMSKTLIDLTYRQGDRFTGSMMIEAQSELGDKNPDWLPLNSREVREIQRRGYPYAE